MRRGVMARGGGAAGDLRMAMAMGRMGEDSVSLEA